MASSVSPTYVRRWHHIYRKLVDDRDWRVLFTYIGYRDKLPDCLLALAWVPINSDDLSEFVYRQCASELDR